MMDRSDHVRRFAPVAPIVAWIFAAPFASASTMENLLEGNDLRLEYRDGSAVNVSFQPDGTYITSTGSSGSWTLDGEALCTVRASDDHSSCGVLAGNKSPGEQWPSTDGEGKPVTATVTPAL